MSAWDEDYIDEKEEGFFEFDEKGGGKFHFGYVHGRMDCRLATRASEAAVEWSCEGDDGTLITAYCNLPSNSCHSVSTSIAGPFVPYIPALARRGVEPGERLTSCPTSSATSPSRNGL